MHLNYVFFLFTLFVLGILMFDLLVVGKGKGSHIISFKESLIWTSVWVSFALLFYLFLFYFGERIHSITNYQQLEKIVHLYAPRLKLNSGNYNESIQLYRHTISMEYITGYLIEYTLSIDNIFVIILILSTFSVREKFFKEILFWGILGAIILRFLFIFIGAALIQRFEWILLIFGGFLVYSGIKMFIDRKKDEKIEPQNHWLIKFLSKHFKIYKRFVKSHFFIRTKDKRLYITPLFLVLIFIEFTDLIFAMDSIPAVFAITRDPYIVFFSNIFAIIGLRSLFFTISKIINLFRYLKIGISFLLVFVGIKLLFHTWLEAIGFGTKYSLIIILSTLIISILASVMFPSKQKNKLQIDYQKPNK